MEAGRWRGAVGAGVTLLLCAMLSAEARTEPPVETDEPARLTTSDLVWELLATGSGPARWAAAFDERGLGDWGNKNPPLGKYLIGGSIAHVEVARPFDYAWSWGISRAEQTRLPPDHLLRAGRVPIRVMGWLCLVTVFALAHVLTAGSLWALLAPLLLFLVPSFQYHALRIYTDVPEVWLILLSVLLLMQHARNGKRAWLFGGMVCGGLACAVKLSAGAMCVGAALYVLHLALRRNIRPWVAATALAAAPLAYVAINPYLYPNPVGRSFETIEQWGASKQAQQQDARLKLGAVHSRAEGMALVSKRGVWLEAHLATPRTSSIEHLPLLLPAGLLLALAGALALLAAGRRPRLAGSRRVTGAFALAILLAWMAQLGLTAELHLLGPLLAAGALAIALRSRARGPREPALVLLYTLGASWLLTGLWLPFDWKGYYLPVACLAVAVPALGAAALSDCVTFARTRPEGAPLPWMGRAGLAASALAAVAILVWSWDTLMRLPLFA